MSIWNRLRFLIRANSPSLLQKKRLDDFLGRLIQLLERLRQKMSHLEETRIRIENDYKRLSMQASDYEARAQAARHKGDIDEAAALQQAQANFVRQQAEFSRSSQKIRDYTDKLRRQYEELEALRNREGLDDMLDEDSFARKFAELDEQLRNDQLEAELQALKRQMP